MSELQTFLALVVVIYVLCVIVQAVQEIVKSASNTKAKTLEDAIKGFMGKDLLTIGDVTGALEKRGLDIKALEKLNQSDFRQLLDGIQFTPQQIAAIPTVLGIPGASVDQFKDHAAAAFDGLMAKFQQSYSAHNKKWVIGISFVVVLALNASLIKIYEVLSVNQTMSQAIAGSASTFINSNPSTPSGGATESQDLAHAYTKNREAINAYLKKYPVLLRTSEYSNDLKEDAFLEILGLLLMGGLVSLGAPFWNDVIKSITGFNNALNGGSQKSR